MAAITWDDVESIAPEMSSVIDGAQALILDHVNTVLAVHRFGGESAPALKLARIYLAAHTASGLGSTDEGATQEVQSESMGGLTRTYVTAGDGGSVGDLSSTSYGRQYIMIVNQVVGRGPLLSK